MQAYTFWKTVTMDQANLLESLVAVFDEHEIQYCAIGSQAVNAYVEPLVSLDLVVVVRQFDQVKDLLNRNFDVKQSPHSLNVSLAGSDLRVQIQMDERYAPFVERAARREVLGLKMPVASLEDVLQGKIWAAQDSQRRGSKRQKDLADIARILEKYPTLRVKVPQEIRARLVGDSMDD